MGIYGMKDGCKNRLMTGAYRALACRMPCKSTNAKVRRAIYNQLKGTDQACRLKDIIVNRPLDSGGSDLYVLLDTPKGMCSFGWGCRRSITKVARKTVSTKQATELWLGVAKFFFMLIADALTLPGLKSSDFRSECLYNQ